jgi:hypothetical protein
MTLREFYTTICAEFNEGKPLDYKFTDPGGYWKMTKGFDGHGLKEMKASQWLKIIELCTRDIEEEHKNDIRSRGRPTKKVQNKYIELDF